MSHKAPSAKRCIKTWTRSAALCPARCAVIKHRAPNGALRLCSASSDDKILLVVIKHRAPNGALRRFDEGLHVLDGGVEVIKHRAPNGALRPPRARSRNRTSYRSVIKHRAPNGALRQRTGQVVPQTHTRVIKHRAPNGALRQPAVLPLHYLGLTRHKAPSAKRCIKTEY